MKNGKFNTISLFTMLSFIALYFLTAKQAYALNMTFNNESIFLAQLSTYVSDDYSNSGYNNGDIIDGTFFDIFSNSAMSNVLGETNYTATQWDNQNIILHDNENYCAGCNGSFNLDFTATSVGTSAGVYGVGFSVDRIETDPQYFAFVTYGNADTQNVALGQGYWGFTSDDLIESIHIGLINGGSTGSGSIQIDDLTVGSNITAVPEPSTLLLLGSGLLGLVGLNRRRKA